MKLSKSVGINTICLPEDKSRQKFHFEATQATTDTQNPLLNNSMSSNGRGKKYVHENDKLGEFWYNKVHFLH